MSWLRVDDGFMRNRKIANLSDRAFRLHMGGLCYCAANLTDGALDGRAVRVVAAEVDIRRPRPLIVELVESELWLPTGDGYLVKDFLEYNPPAEAAKELKRSRQEAGRLGGIRSGASRRGEANVKQVLEASRLNPVPSHKDQKTLGEAGLFSLERVAARATSAALTEGLA